MTKPRKINKPALHRKLHAIRKQKGMPLLPNQKILEMAGAVAGIAFANRGEMNEWLIAYEIDGWQKRPKKEKGAIGVRIRAAKSQSQAFYESDAWRALRYLVIKKYRAACMACGRTPRENGIVIHVDHIKPRSKYPELELEFDNLQLLCEACNLGKSNKDETDWRS